MIKEVTYLEAVQQRCDRIIKSINITESLVNIIRYQEITNLELQVAFMINRLRKVDKSVKETMTVNLKNCKELLDDYYVLLEEITMTFQNSSK